MAESIARLLLPRTTCPYCWHQYPPDEVLYIASHEDLRGDVRLGEDEMMRFRPSRFNLAGHALDGRGLPCQALACPRCHLPITEALLSTEPLFVSILGTPGCGKSFYLAGLTWELRRLLAEKFAVSVADADPVVNRVLNAYESSLFLRDNTSQPVPLARLIQKTDLAGNTLYASVSFGSQRMLLPRPFLFTLRPTPKHPATDPVKLCRVMCLYDNPGEHFLPGADSAAQPTTRHLALSQVLLYLFDPTQDPRFRQAVKARSGHELPPGPTARQELVLREAATRVRRLTGMPPEARHKYPLVVVLTKYDVWRGLFDVPGDDPWLSTGQIMGLDRDLVASRSVALRNLLLQTCPEVVQAAEEFAKTVYYWPVSPLGTPPCFLSGSPLPHLRPGVIKPLGVTAPLLIGLHNAVPGLITAARVKKQAPSGPPTPRPGQKVPGGTEGWWQ